MISPFTYFKDLYIYVCILIKIFTYVQIGFLRYSLLVYEGSRVTIHSAPTLESLKATLPPSAMLDRFP